MIDDNRETEHRFVVKLARSLAINRKAHGINDSDKGVKK